MNVSHGSDPDGSGVKDMEQTGDQGDDPGVTDQGVTDPGVTDPGFTDQGHVTGFSR